MIIRNVLRILRLQTWSLVSSLGQVSIILVFLFYLIALRPPLVQTDLEVLQSGGGHVQGPTGAARYVLSVNPRIRGVSLIFAENCIQLSISYDTCVINELLRMRKSLSGLPSLKALRFDAA